MYDDLGIGDAVELWLTTKVDSQEIAESTGKDYQRTLTRFAADIGPDTPVADISSSTFQLWLSRVRKRNGEKYDPRSLNTMAAPVRSFFGEMFVFGHIDADPTARIKRAKQTNKLPNVAKPEDVRAILAHASSWERLLILIMVQSGGRRFEAAKARAEDYNAAKQQFTFVEGKGGKTVVLPICDELAEAFDLHIATLPRAAGGSGPLFLSPRNAGRPIAPRTVNNIFQRLSERAGVRVAPHMLRHLFAMTGLDDGVPANAMRDLMRHESLQTLDSYSRLRPDQLAKHVGSQRYDQDERPDLRAV